MWSMFHITVTESLNSTQCRTCPPLFSLTSCATTAVGALVLPGLSSGGLVQWPQTYSQTHVLCQPCTASPHACVSACVHAGMSHWSNRALVPPHSPPSHLYSITPCHDLLGVGETAIKWRPLAGLPCDSIHHCHVHSTLNFPSFLLPTGSSTT